MGGLSLKCRGSVAGGFCGRQFFDAKAVAGSFSVKFPVVDIFRDWPL